MSAGYTLPKDWDDESAALTVSSAAPRSFAQSLGLREERDASKRSLAKQMSESTQLNQSERAHKARHVESVVDEWLRDKESAFARIVPNRMVTGVESGRRA